VKKVVYLLLLAFLGTGCTMLVKTPVVKVRDLNVVSLDGSGVEMQLHLMVQNANPYDIKLLGYNYDLKVMTLPLAKGEARDEVSFPAGVETDLRIPIKVSYGDLLEILKGLDPNQIPYVLQAGLDLQTPLGRLNLPVTHTGTYAVPKQFRPGSLLNKLGNFLKQNGN
jgi:LEA14-like dessication related protein